MSQTHLTQIAEELNVNARQVEATAQLLDADATVPFIARYRKEATGNLDEVAVIAIRDRLGQLRELDARRETILASLQEQGQLTDALKQAVQAAATMAVLEDLYLPYRPKRRTRGTIAKERGLEPLATALFAQSPRLDVQAEAARFVDPAQEVPTAEDALAGARDIIAEWINEDAEIRAALRELFLTKGILSSKLIKTKEAEASKYKDYFDWSEPVASAPSHRILAVRRGAAEGMLSFHIQPDEQTALEILRRRFLTSTGPASDQVALALQDAYKRLLSLSMETEARLASKKRADEEAIRVFAENLRELLLASPLGQMRVLALDPGFRTGCKLVCLDAQGRLLHNDTIYPLEPQRRTEQAAATLKALVQQYAIEAIAVGNGTGGREAHAFCRDADLGRTVPVVMVNESGASVYSASQAAREEFPEQDLTVRGAVSIGRRLMDPLAELVKIDPKSIGVGQYQHDVEPKALKTSLDDTVVSCVNAVGVEVNTASKQLLSYVSGLSDRLAGSIVTWRNENGPFRSRRQLLEVAGLGPKTFEQSAGFLRIRGAANPLDASAVHPESYGVVEAMAGDLGCTVPDLVARAELRAKIALEKYVTETVGLPTLRDILSELAKPGRDPREPFELFAYADDVHAIGDLKPGMKLPGVVTNVTAFGAFVDVGVHQDGLVHISELADRFVEKPGDVVKVHQKVTVTVLEVDLDRSRIALSMKTNPGSPRRADRTEPPAPQAERAPSRPQGRGKTKSSPPPSRRAEPDLSNNPFRDFFKGWKPKK